MKYVFNEEGEQQFPLLRIQRKRVPRWGTMAFEELATHKLKKKSKCQKHFLGQRCRVIAS